MYILVHVAQTKVTCTYVYMWSILYPLCSIFPSMMHHRRTASDTATALFNRPSAELKKEGPSSSHSSRSATPLIASFLRTQEAPPPPSSAPAIQMSPQQQPSKQQAQQSQSQSQQHQPTQVQCTCAIGSVAYCSVYGTWNFWSSDNFWGKIFAWPMLVFYIPILLV